nr:HAMP domain-containing sensor histidine kinase [Halorubrum sp. 2020YC2]
MVSHDLRNPLSVATGNLELYRETEDKSHLETVETSLTRIQDLVTDLTTLARHDTPAETHEPVSVHEIARDAWELTETRSATLSTEPCTVTGDPSQFMALFENLFRNAVGHGGEAVTVRVGPLEHGFYVEDTGEGIPPEERDSVFDHGYTTGTAEAGSDSRLSHVSPKLTTGISPSRTVRKAVRDLNSDQQIRASSVSYSRT